MDSRNILLTIVLLVNLLLFIIVYFKGKKGKVNLSWSIVIGTVIFWIFSMIFYRNSATDDSLFWVKILYISAIFIPVSFLYFSFLYPEGKLIRNRNFHILIFLSIVIVILFIILPNLIIKEVVVKSGQEKEIIWGPAYFLYALYVSGYFTWSLWNLFKKYLKLSGILKTQTSYILLGTSISIFLGLIFNLIIPWSGNFRFNWLGQITTLFLVGFTSYAIVKYRLMDIRLVLGRGAVYAFSTTTIVAFAFLLTFLNSRFLGNVSFNISGPVILIICILLSRSIFQFFENFASKYFYYTFYSYQKVLTDLGRRLTRVLDLDTLSSLIIGTLIDTMKLDRTIILLRRGETGDYEIQKNIGFKEENGISLVKDNFLTQYLEHTQNPLVYDEISFIMRDTRDQNEKEKLGKIRENMKTIEAALCLPLLIEEKIIGMIVLGSKVSRNPYSQQDIDLLTNLANQASIALQNAILYDQVQDLSENLQQKVDEQTKELKKAYEELQKLDKAKSEFVSIASHQLRTPLTAIKGYISMMLEKTYGEPSAKMKRPLENIYTSNERLINLVNDLLNISRIESGKIEVHLEDTALEEVIASIIEELRHQAEIKGIYLKFEKPAPEKPMPKILADKDKMRQVIMNIIDNGIRYTNRGGLTVETKIRNNKYQIKIKDTGTGMTKDEISYLFESFSRGKAGNRFWTEGAGLGLYIAKKFVEMHHGKVWAESKGKGKGSAFFIELPVRS